MCWSRREWREELARRQREEQELRDLLDREQREEEPTFVADPEPAAPEREVVLAGDER